MQSKATVLKCCLIGFFALGALLIILIIGCLATPRWIKTGNNTLSIEGGLLKCAHCDKPFEDLTYHEASDAAICSRKYPDYSGYCSRFKDLQDAGGAYLFFELVALLFIIFWMVQLVFQLGESSLLSNPHWLTYGIAPVATASHILGLIVWGGVTRSSFDGNCSLWNLDGSKPELCSTDGPGLSIAIMVFLLIGTGVYSCMLCITAHPTSQSSSRESSYTYSPPGSGMVPNPPITTPIDLQLPENI